MCEEILNNIQTESITNARNVIKTILKQTLDNPNNPESVNFFQADTYRFYFLMSFMWEHLEDNEMSQEYVISLVPKKYASRIKRLQILKQAVALGYIDEKSSSIDKRRRIYKPTPMLVEDFLKYTNSLYNQNKSTA
tara:strand:+ start:65 stop:472 length:408 start_codon:yes stop_codon:yes gene_type:complete